MVYGGVYVGIDTPEQMGFETGSSAAVPIVQDFLTEALKDKSPVPFRIPEGVTLAPVNRDTGETSYIGAPNFILEAFRPGTEPSIGGLSSSIRVGSGSDTRSAYSFGDGFGDAGDDTFSYDDDVASTPEDRILKSEDGDDSPSDTDVAGSQTDVSVADSDARELTTPSVDGADVVEAVTPPNPDAVKLPEVGAVTPIKKEPAPEPDAIDDGLY